MPGVAQATGGLPVNPAPDSAIIIQRSSLSLLGGKEQWGPRLTKAIKWTERQKGPRILGRAKSLSKGTGVKEDNLFWRLQVNKGEDEW